LAIRPQFSLSVSFHVYFTIGNIDFNDIRRLSGGIGPLVAASGENVPDTGAARAPETPVGNQATNRSVHPAEQGVGPSAFLSSPDRLSALRSE